MKLNSLLKLTATCVIVSFLSIQTSLAAGFHYQLDLTAKLVQNPSSEITAIQMSWIYDKELSAILMDGEDLSEANKEATLKKRAADIFSGLRDVKYFTKLAIDKRNVEFADVETYVLRLNKESRLQMNLTLPLKESQQVKGHTLEITVTDDSAVGLATFVDTNHMLLSDQVKALCKEPTLVQKKLAEVDGHAQITETMTLDCTS